MLFEIWIIIITFIKFTLSFSWVAFDVKTLMKTRLLYYLPQFTNKLMFLFELVNTQSVWGSVLHNQKTAIRPVTQVEWPKKRQSVALTAVFTLVLIHSLLNKTFAKSNIESISFMYIPIYFLIVYFIIWNIRNWKQSLNQPYTTNLLYSYISTLMDSNLLTKVHYVEGLMKDD